MHVYPLGGDEVHAAADVKREHDEVAHAQWMCRAAPLSLHASVAVTVGTQECLQVAVACVLHHNVHWFCSMHIHTAKVTFRYIN